MILANNAMDILKLLPRTNCKSCHEPTCLVFAVNVFNGNKDISNCPYISREIADRFQFKVKRQDDAGEQLLENINELKRKILEIDFSEAAIRTGAEIFNDSMVIKVFGKDVRIEKNANLASDIHLHPWIVIPILNYAMNCSGTELTGKWVSMRDLKGGLPWNGLFEQRCEKPLRRIIDNHPELFEFMTQIFNARNVTDDTDADVSIVLTPLPRLPILIRYWQQEEGMESSLGIFFDSSAQENLDLDSIYAMGSGLVRMFEKIAHTHA